MGKRQYGRVSEYERKRRHETDPDLRVSFDPPIFQAAKSFTVVDPITGKKHRKRVVGTGGSPTEAYSRFEAALARYYKRGNDLTAPVAQKTPEERMTVEEWIRQWHREVVRQGSVTETVARKYIRIMENHVLDAAAGIAQLPLVDLKRSHLARLFQEVLPGKHHPDGRPLLGGGGQANVFKPLKLALNEAVNAELILRNPMNGLAQPKHVRPDEDVISKKNTLSLLMEAIEGRPDEAQHLFAFLGLRRSERLGLTWSAFSGLGDGTGNTTVRIWQQLARYENGDGYYLKPTLKTERSVRVIPVLSVFEEPLLAHKRRQDEWKATPEWQPEPRFRDLVFTTPTGKPITQNRDNEEWHKVLSENGFDYWRGHLNRHVTATYFANLEPPVPLEVIKQILGHSKETMTLYYIAFGARAMKAPMELFNNSLISGREAAGHEAHQKAPRYKATGLEPVPDESNA